MFKIPDWEDSVPQSKAAFMPKAKENIRKAKGPKLNAESSNLNLNKIKKTNQKVLRNKNKVNTSKKKKHDNEINIERNNKRKVTTHRNTNIQNTKQNSKKIIGSNTADFDEILLNAKKMKFNKVIEDEDREDLLFEENKQEIVKNMNEEVKPNASKLRLKAILAKSNRNYINVTKTSNKLRDRMLDRLKAAQFRYLNEKLYTSSGMEAQQLFQGDPKAFKTYHQGYQLQVKKWPVNPLDVIVKRIIKMPKTHLIVDMGCGEAALSKRVPHQVRSFDLVAAAPSVEACDMARTPLLTSSVDTAVYCLALMGTNLTQYLVEANRVLKMGGHLLIAEVESRFEKVENFAKEVERLGFKLKLLDRSNNVFFFMEFTKIREPPVKKAKLPEITLKPCLYKRR